MLTTAALSRGPESPFSLEEVDISDPLPNEVLVRLVATGICHTDLGSKAVSSTDSVAVYGHEGAGIVEKVGAGVSGIEVGNKVVLSYNSCGVCPRCVEGHRAYCRDFGSLNASGARPDGTTPVTQNGKDVWSSFFGQSSFARHAIATKENVVVVGDDVDLISAAPMGCGFQTGAGAVINVLSPKPDSSLVVFGSGGVGMAAIMAAHALGVETIIAVDLSADRRDLAFEIGATHVLDGADVDLIAHVKAITGEGASHAFDTTAVPSVVRTAAQALAPLGTLVLVGIGQPEIAFDVNDLIMSGKTVRGCIEGDAEAATLIPRLLEWQKDGKFPVDQIIRTYPFEKINDAVADAHGAVVKPVLVF